MSVLLGNRCLSEGQDRQQKAECGILEMEGAKIPLEGGFH